ncbi:MAG: hypothetical protein U5R30_15395 [Deltaproteobacteria bacterium]|nr:hypothetical protein [Deltaproteobacteria bacterium]
MRELSHFLRGATHPLGLDDADGKTPKASNVFRAMAGSYPAAVFVIVPVDNVVATVFDAPVAAVGGQNAFGIGLFRGTAGDAVGDFAGILAAFFLRGLPLDDKSLSDMGKVQIVVEFGCNPDFAISIRPWSGGQS